MSRRPSVLFVCVHNAGKSQTAAAIMRHVAGSVIDVYSAGTAPGHGVSVEAQAALAEIGLTMGDEFPKPISPELLRSVDRVVVLGDEAVVSPIAGMRGTIETWLTVEPATEGIHGAERARIVRDDIKQRVQTLHLQLRGNERPTSPATN